jgi:hypothetical protein
MTLAHAPQVGAGRIGQALRDMGKDAGFTDIMVGRQDSIPVDGKGPVRLLRARARARPPPPPILAFIHSCIHMHAFVLTHIHTRILKCMHIYIM